MTETAWLPEDAPATRLFNPAKASIGMENVPCWMNVQFSIFFDGTRNHRIEDLPTGAHSNVVRLFGACVEQKEALIRQRFRRKRDALHVATLAVVALVLAGCKPPERSSDPNARVGGSLTSMDYEPTDTFVRPVYVDGRGGDSAGTGGSTVLSAISLPQRWHPGLTVNVRWRRCARGTFYTPGVPQNEGCRWIEKDVPVHPYTYVGRTWLHIFADDEVLVIPSMKGPNHPDYPGAEFPYKDFHERQGIGKDE